ncbi:MAG: endonuclease III [Gammaproteobacteria bacterium]|nr:endonuclease III [Gammaproteobacteria bacterium]
MNPRTIRAMFKRLRAVDPAPTTELRYESTFELLIAVILSAQATDVSVNLATAKLYPVANTPQALLDLGKARLKRHIKTIGLYNTKADNILKTCRLILDRHGGQVPDTREQLEALPGVGRKTANVILNTAFGQPLIAVDTHVFRVSNRTRIAPGKDALAVERALHKAVPDEFKQHAHHWLILLGRHTCTARKPKCPECPLRDLCPCADSFGGSSA